MCYAARLLCSEVGHCDVAGDSNRRNNWGCLELTGINSQSAVEAVLNETASILLNV